MIPEIDTNTPAPTNTAQLFRKAGCLIIRHMLNTDLVTGMRQAFADQYEPFLSGQRKDALVVGDRRLKITVSFRPPFDTPMLFAHPFVLPIMREILDPGAILTSQVCVAALPGANDQDTHRDHPWLFGTPLDRLLPSYAVKLVIPLVEQTRETGMIRLWPGSHSVDDVAAQEIPPLDAGLHQGDCLLMDYRLMHRGLANRSQHIRPVLFISYGRRWFIDHDNFELQNQLDVPPGFIDSLSSEKQLFHRAIPC